MPTAGRKATFRTAQRNILAVNMLRFYKQPAKDEKSAKNCILEKFGLILHGKHLII